MALAAAFVASPILPTKAQLTQGGEPRSFKKIIPVVNIPTQTLGAVDVEKLLEEDAQRRELGKEFDRRFGYTFDVNFNLSNSGIWINLPNGDRIWQLTISSPGALSINLTFSKYNLPEGADLFIVGQHNKIGSLTRMNNQADEKLGTGLIRGDQVSLEYYEPASVRGQGKLEIGKATHGYKDPFSILNWGDSDVCEMNVNCPKGAPWTNEKRSAVRIIDNGDLCSGAMINNLMQDGKPYMLTANHCFNNNSSTWVYSFNWESPTCTTPSVAIPENQTLSGGILRARNGASDFCLMELSSKPPAAFNIFYSGWSALNIPSQSTTIIHHPSGDIKKITFDTDPATHSGYGLSAPNDSSHWKTANYEFATTTEGGSSGSPMYDQNHRIVGQLHGGPASCTNISADFYGKVSKSWNGGGTAATRLKDWLDPLNTGVLAQDGLDPACNRIAVTLPWKRNIDTVTKPLPYLWKVKNPNADSTFRLVSGGFNNASGKALRMNAENTNPVGRKDSLILVPVSVSKYKNLTFHFHHAYRRFATTTTDSLKLMVSRDCGSSYKSLAKWGGASFVTDATNGATSPFQPADTTLWAHNEIALDSTYNRAEQLVFAFGFTSGNAGTLWLDEFIVTGDTAKNKPVARFESNKTSGCAGVQIQFSDSSLYNPTSWNWIFEGGNPATSTLQNPQVTYPSEGVFQVKLVATNEEGKDTLTESGYITIQTIGQAVTPFLDPVASAGNFPPSGYVLQNPENNVTWVQSTVNSPGSTGGSMMFDNFSNPNVSGQIDRIIFPAIQTAGKNHLKLRIKYAYKYYTNFGGAAAPDTLTVGFTGECGGAFKPLWKKGGVELATAGTTTQNYTPVATDWRTISFNLDSLLPYPSVSIGFENKFGFGNRLFIDDIYIDTVDNCPGMPVVQVNTDTICSGQTLVLQMDSVANGTYSWTGPGNFNSTSRIATRVVANNNSGTYSGTVTVNGCTSPTGTVAITVVANPAVPTITVTGNTLTAPANFVNYIWILNGDTLPENTRVLNITESGSYVVVVFNAAGCFRASNPRIVTSSDNLISKNGVSMYPNPASSSLRIQSSSENISLDGIVNALGQSFPVGILKKGFGFMEIDVRSLPSGTYWARVRNGNKTIVIPVTKD